MGCRYAGIDWATEKHDVLVAEEDGSEVLAGAFVHDEKGLSALCRTLVRLEVRLVAIERPDGLLVERLLDAGLEVLALHPNKVAAARDRFRVSGGKSDRFDAFVLCELARTDHHRFRILEPDCDQTKAIRALTRAREDLVQTRTGVMNQLRAELERFWPGPLRLFSHMDAEILLAFLERYPSPPDADGLGVARMQAFLVRERYSRAAPNRADGQAAQCPTQHDRCARAHRTPAARAHLRSDDPHAQRTDQRPRTPDPDPDTRAPRRADLPLAVQIAQQCDHRRRAPRRDRRLPRALPHPGRARRRRRPGCRRDRVRQMEDRRLPTRMQQTTASRVLSPWQCWRNHTTYDPTQHRALQRHITVTIPTPSGPATDQAATRRLAGPGLWRPDLTTAATGT
ncbi:MAG: IS110 family transposase [Solirubrobacteraceae bacterium]